jgi:FlaA1/EpsC-like NDP-sugar epimerase
MKVLALALLLTGARALSGPRSHVTAYARSSIPAMTTRQVSRRELLAGASLGGVAPLLASLPAAAMEQRPVLVLGASGGTGLECVEYLVSCGRPCIAATRSGELAGALAGNALVTVAKGDVTNEASLAALITRGSLGGVIYAASASRQKEAKATSNAKAVDRDGVVACAKLCIASEVPRLVLVSSGGVSKPTSAVYLFLNTVANGIMKAKIDGEDALRRLYLAPEVVNKGVGYTVVRP